MADRHGIVSPLLRTNKFKYRKRGGFVSSEFEETLIHVLGSIIERGEGSESIGHAELLDIIKEAADLMEQESEIGIAMDD